MPTVARLEGMLFTLPPQCPVAWRWEKLEIGLLLLPLIISPTLIGNILLSCFWQFCSLFFYVTPRNQPLGYHLHSLSPPLTWNFCFILAAKDALGDGGARLIGLGLSGVRIVLGLAQWENPVIL